VWEYAKVSLAILPFCFTTYSYIPSNLMASFHSSHNSNFRDFCQYIFPMSLFQHGSEYLFFDMLEKKKKGLTDALGEGWRLVTLIFGKSVGVKLSF